jgi:hypothetical protein
MRRPRRTEVMTGTRAHHGPVVTSVRFRMPHVYIGECRTPASGFDIHTANSG